MARENDPGKAQSRSGETLEEANKKAHREMRRLEKAELDTPRKPRSDEDRDEEGQERLNKVLARAGVGSRRAVDELMRAGKVGLNGQVVTQLGQKVDVDKDRVTVNGHRVSLLSKDAQIKLYVLLNKPPQVLTTVKDDRGRKTVMDFVVGAVDARIYPVGRLDYDAEGALLLTNDGDLAAALMHPKRHVPKLYRVKVKGEPEESRLDILRRGVRLDDGPTGPCEIRVVSKARVNTWVEVTLTEGKNRQLKRMFWRIHHPVMKIQRVKYGPIELGELEPGDYRELTKAEIDKLRKAVM